MDKRETLTAILKNLLKLKLGKKNIIDGRDLDKIIYLHSNKLDKNVKYEFRSFLTCFGFINRYRSKEIDQNDAFILESAEIKTFLGESK